MTEEEIYKNLNLDKDLLESALRLARQKDLILKKRLPDLLKGKTAAIKKSEPLENLALILLALPYTYEKYRQMQIDDSVFISTFSDIKIWCDNAFEQYGVKGLVNIRWIAKHLSLRIFRIGRLQYEFSRFAILPNAGIKNIISCPYRLGEKCITLHIPQGEKLDNALCRQSLEDATEFFSKHFPDYKYRCYTVITWLLNPELGEVLGKDSNIVKFGKMFTLLGRVPDSDMNERRVFGYKKDRKNYMPSNALQRYTLDRIKKEKPLYSYNGFLPKNKFTD